MSLEGKRVLCETYICIRFDSAYQQIHFRLIMFETGKSLKLLFKTRSRTFIFSLSRLIVSIHSSSSLSDFIAWLATCYNPVLSFFHTLLFSFLVFLNTFCTQNASFLVYLLCVRYFLSRWCSLFSFALRVVQQSDGEQSAAEIDWRHSDE